MLELTFSYVRYGKIGKLQANDKQKLESKLDELLESQQTFVSMNSNFNGDASMHFSCIVNKDIFEYDGNDITITIPVII